MKVLHVWDQAGVGSIMAMYQRKQGLIVEVAKIDFHDGAGFDECYGNYDTFNVKKAKIYRLAKSSLPNIKCLKKFLYKVWVLLPTFRFYLHVSRKATHFDLIHVHSVWPVLLFLPFGKPVLLEFHGDDVRSKPTFHCWLNRVFTKLFVLIYSFNHTVLVSTPDLLREVPKARWLPNPVDVGLFAKSKFNPVIGTAFYVHNWYEDGSHANKIVDLLGLKLSWLDRATQAWIPHFAFPEYLGKFEYFIDRQVIHSLSKTALEALSLGLKVVRWDGLVISSLPKCHLPKNVANEAIKIYEEMMNK